MGVCRCCPMFRGTLKTHNSFPFLFVVLFGKRWAPLVHHLPLLSIPFPVQLSLGRTGCTWDTTFLVNWRKFPLEVVFLDHSQAVSSKWDALRKKKVLWSNKFYLLNTSWSLRALGSWKKVWKWCSKGTGVGVFHPVFPRLVCTWNRHLIPVFINTATLWTALWAKNYTLFSFKQIMWGFFVLFF